MLGTKSRRIYVARSFCTDFFVQNLGRVESTGLKIEKTSPEPFFCNNVSHSFSLCA